MIKLSIRVVKQALILGIMFEKVHRMIKFNQKASLKPYIDINTELRKEERNDFEKFFFQLMNNSYFGKIMENVTKIYHFLRDANQLILNYKRF